MAVPEVFSPDLIVTSEDGTNLGFVVELKATDELGGTERQFKEYMLLMRCPLGLIATPRTISLYQNEYTPSDEDSIRLIGRYPAPPSFASARTERALYDAVRGWLERLPAEPDFGSESAELRAAVRYYIAPSLMEGVLRAAGPRY